ncbi:hypothetical protein [Pedobacter sp. SYSU D00535]|uniref:hypothetical protein n=1 Tax=Pedobacter sp. SYSU D00535 TaxID=2810308 RepID=UPI001A964673|nr:hypothetical protein [Pedobacter sp. SYSU D00535]
MKRVLQLAFIILAINLLACKKQERTIQSGTDIIRYHVEHGSITTIKEDERIVEVKINDFVSRKALAPIFQLSPGAIATVDGVVQRSSVSKLDLTKPVKYVITAEDGKQAEWIVVLKSNSFEIGLGNETTEENRLERAYDWYIPQEYTGELSKFNSGPVVVKMAAYWSNVLHLVDFEEMRAWIDAYKENLKPSVPASLPFFTSDLGYYLRHISVAHEYVSILNNIDRLKDFVDAGYISILLVDMQKIPFNIYPEQRTGKIYKGRDNTTDSRYVIVKGYKVVDGILWFEVYDPYSNGERYKDGTLKGKNRYYSAKSLSDATVDHWPYCIVVAPKPFPVEGVNGLNPHFIRQQAGN